MKDSRLERWEMTIENIEMQWKQLEGKKGRKIKEKGTGKGGRRKERYKNGTEHLAKTVPNFLTVFVQTLADVLY